MRCRPWRERASPCITATQRIGWLNRLLGELPGSSPLQGLAVGDTPGAFYGPEPIMGFRRLDRVGIAGDDTWDPTGERVRSLSTIIGILSRTFFGA